MAAAMELRGHKRYRYLYLYVNDNKKEIRKKKGVNIYAPAFFLHLSLGVYNTPRYITQVLVCVCVL